MRYKAVLSYDGHQYLGFQRQVKGKTIQGEVERAIKHMTKMTHQIHASGRTDRGVHALKQVFHMDSDLPIEPDQWLRGINQRLPKDIRILSFEQTSHTFHARHDAKKKKYRYMISKTPSKVFDANYEVYVPNFDNALIMDAPKYLVGTHDFKGFCEHVKGKETIRHMYAVSIVETKKHYVLTFVADGFLKYMVRSICGLLIEIATQKKPLSTISEVLNTGNKLLAGKTASPEGLYLVNVYY